MEPLRVPQPRAAVPHKRWSIETRLKDAVNGYILFNRSRSRGASLLTGPQRQRKTPGTPTVIPANAGIHDHGTKSVDR